MSAAPIAHAGWITVPQVFRDLGLTPTNEQSWSAGARVRALYLEQYETLPPKDNRPKTSGGGSHCFALYPPHWRPKIEGVIADLRVAQSGQKDLFA